MSASARPRMSADDFIRWASAQPEGEHHELVAGAVFAMGPQRSGHALAAFRVARRLAEAVEAAGLPCFVYGDGMAVVVDDGTVYEPDAMLRCGPPLPFDALYVADPLIIVEVLSPSTRGVDSGLKLSDYFRVPSVRHYLVVRAEMRVVTHHRRDDAGGIATRIVRDGALTLDPPGLTLRDLFD